ncbi:MAG TPA: uroporphyrinogen decarboxylase [Polyangiaceae bacterium]
MWDRFIRACRGEAVDTTPVWFMRQAGRYMAEYRALRSKHKMLELCKTPELAVEVTLQPLRAHAVDAAILFADLLLPLEPMGAPFDFLAGEGPVIERPVRTGDDIARLRVIDPEADGLAYVLEAIRMLRRELDGKTPLIGFAGGPFTLASYLIEGGKSSHYVLTKRLMFSEPALWHELAGKLAEVVRRFFRAQIAAGVQAVQLFDSWVGALGPDDFATFVEPHLAHILKDIETTGVPVIHFGTGTQSLLELQKRAGGTVIGVDWRTPLDEASRRLGADTVLQGNLDPVALFAPREILDQKLTDVLLRGKAAKGHIFNLGHGILPETDPNVVSFVADRVHELGARNR